MAPRPNSCPVRSGRWSGGSGRARLPSSTTRQSSPCLHSKGAEAKHLMSSVDTRLLLAQLATVTKVSDVCILPGARCPRNSRAGALHLAGDGMEHSVGDAAMTGGELAAGQDWPAEEPAADVAAAALQARADVMFSGRTDRPVASGERRAAERPTYGLVQDVVVVAKLPSAPFNKDTEPGVQSAHSPVGWCPPARQLASRGRGSKPRVGLAACSHLLVAPCRQGPPQVDAHHITARCNRAPRPCSPRTPPTPRCRPSGFARALCPDPSRARPARVRLTSPLSGRRRRSLPQRSSQVARATFRFLCRLFSFF